MKVVLASHNAKKITEMRAILSQMGVEVLSQRDVGVDLEPEETGTTFEANARIKAKAVLEATGLPAIADDSGLMVDALDGAPGVYSARYGGPGLDDTRPVAAAAEEYGGTVPPDLPVRQRDLLRLSRRVRDFGPGRVPRRSGRGTQRGGGLWL